MQSCSMLIRRSESIWRCCCNGSDRCTGKRKDKNIAKSNRADARILMRIYMMERFLERVANSPYSENFIIKGGILVTSMIGISMRSTMDIDTSIRNLDLSEEKALRIINKISKIDLQDGVTFNVKDCNRNHGRYGIPRHSGDNGCISW